ncbi:MAG: hypothetical protein NTY47_01880, partial [Candidatus Omnitrophica bacterium]|nr:hypothetical protein [Candidatus Omnitrophota bacterium]
FKYLYERDPKGFSGFANAYRQAGGKIEVAENSTQAGPDAWVLLAAATYTFRTGDKQYLPMCRADGDWLLSLQNNEGGIRRGHNTVTTGDKSGLTDQAQELEEYSTEHNESAYGGLKALGQVTGEAKYTQAADRIAEWFMLRVLYDVKKDKKGIIIEAKIARGGRFINGIWEADNTFAPDVYSWAIASFGPEKLVKMGISLEVQIWMLDDLHKRANAKSIYKKPGSGEIIEVEGYDTTDEKTAESERGRYKKDNSVPEAYRGQVVRMIGVEWSEQIIQANRIVAQYAREKGDKPTADKLETRAAKMDAELDRLRDEEGALPYATLANMPTGHGWNTPASSRSLSGTIYDYLGRIGDNPFTLERETSGTDAAVLDLDKVFAPADSELLGALSALMLSAKASSDFNKLSQQLSAEMQRLSGDQKKGAKELLVLMVSLGKPIANNVATVKIGGVMVNLVPAGAAYDYMNIINIGKGLFNGELFKQSLGSQLLGIASLIQSLFNVINSKDFEHFKDASGLLFVRYVKNYGIAGYTKTQLFTSPGLEHRADGYWYFVPGFEPGEEVFVRNIGMFPILSAIPGVGMLVGASELPKEKDSAYFYGKNEMRANLERWLNPNVRYFVQRPASLASVKAMFEHCEARVDAKGWRFIEENWQHLKIMIRRDMSKPEAVRDQLYQVSFAYVSREYKAKLGFENQTKFEKQGEWLNPGDSYELSGYRDLQKAVEYVKGVAAYGAAIDPKADTTKALMQLAGRPATVKAPVPSREGGKLVLVNGKPVMAMADVDPLTGNIIVPGALGALTDYCMSRGLVGLQKISELCDRSGKVIVTLENPIEIAVPYALAITQHRGIVPIWNENEMLGVEKLTEDVKVRQGNYNVTWAQGTNLSYRSDLAYDTGKYIVKDGKKIPLIIPAIIVYAERPYKKGADVTADQGFRDWATSAETRGAVAGLAATDPKIQAAYDDYVKKVFEFAGSSQVYAQARSLTGLLYNLYIERLRAQAEALSDLDKKLYMEQWLAEFNAWLNGVTDPRTGKKYAGALSWYNSQLNTALLNLNGDPSADTVNGKLGAQGVYSAELAKAGQSITQINSNIT